jgi:hypothetical protein
MFTIGLNEKSSWKNKKEKRRMAIFITLGYWGPHTNNHAH